MLVGCWLWREVCCNCHRWKTRHQRQHHHSRHDRCDEGRSLASLLSQRAVSCLFAVRTEMNLLYKYKRKTQLHTYDLLALCTTMHLPSNFMSLQSSVSLCSNLIPWQYISLSRIIPNMLSYIQWYKSSTSMSPTAMLHKTKFVRLSIIITWMKTCQQDLESFNFSLNEAVDNQLGSESPTLEINVYVWRYKLIVVHIRNEWMNEWWCCDRNNRWPDSYIKNTRNYATDQRLSTVHNSSNYLYPSQLILDWS